MTHPGACISLLQAMYLTYSIVDFWSDDYACFQEHDELSTKSHPWVQGELFISSCLQFLKYIPLRTVHCTRVGLH